MSGTKFSSHAVRDAAHPGRSARAADPSPAGDWAWHPPLPLVPVPVFVWPPRPLATLRYLVSRAFLGSVLLPFFALAAITWLWLHPAPPVARLSARRVLPESAFRPQAAVESAARA